MTNDPQISSNDYIGIMDRPAEVSFGTTSPVPDSIISEREFRNRMRDLKLDRGPKGLSTGDWKSRASSSTLSEGAILTESPRPIREWLFYIPGRNLIIGLSGDPPPWIINTFQHLAELLDLPRNWDSYGAPRIDLGHAEAIFDLLLFLTRHDLPMPTVVPTNRGGIQLEWHTRGIDFEIETLSRTEYQVLFEDRGTEEEWETTISGDLTPLGNYIGNLSRH